MEQKKLYAFLKSYLSDKRIAHTVGVAETAKKLAERNNVNPEKAYLAGMLHDTARELTKEEMLAILKENNYDVEEEEFWGLELLHAPVSALLAREKLDVTDNEVLRAISLHTTGDANMSALDAIVYMADMIEPGRKYPGVEELREITMRDLSDGLLAGIKHTLNFLIAHEKRIHPKSITAYNWLLNKRTEGGKTFDK